MPFSELMSPLRALSRRHANRPRCLYCGPLQKTMPVYLDEHPTKPRLGLESLAFAARPAGANFSRQIFSNRSHRAAIRLASRSPEAPASTRSDWPSHRSPRSMLAMPRRSECRAHGRRKAPAMPRITPRRGARCPAPVRSVRRTHPRGRSRNTPRPRGGSCVRSWAPRRFLRSGRWSCEVSWPRRRIPFGFADDASSPQFPR